MTMLILLPAAALLPACGKADTADALVDEMAAEYAKVPGIIAGATDGPSAAAAADQLDAVERRLRAVADRTRAVTDPPKADQDRLQKKLAAAAAAANAEAAARLADLRAKDPAGAKAVADAYDRLTRALPGLRRD
jgi:hypothetical protein